MSKVVSELHPEPEAEAEPYARIEFNCERPDHTITIHWAECGLDIAISGLKSDLQHVFTINPEDQIWTLRNQTLEDPKTLSSYGLTGTENHSRFPIKIYVKSQR